MGAWRGVNNVSRSWYYEMLSLEIHPIRSKTNKNKTGHKGRTIKWARITRCDHLVRGKMSYYNAVHSSISVGHAFTTIGTCNAYNTNCKPDWWAASGTRLSPGNLGANLRRHLITEYAKVLRPSAFTQPHVLAWLDGQGAKSRG